MVSFNVGFDRDQLQVTQGQPRASLAAMSSKTKANPKLQRTSQVYEDRSADSGNRILRYFCGDCGSPLFSFPDNTPDKTYVKAGVLDEVERVVPREEIVSKIRRREDGQFKQIMSGKLIACRAEGTGDESVSDIRDHIRYFVLINKRYVIATGTSARPSCSRVRGRGRLDSNLIDRRIW
jgi:hypothetical protein